MAKRYDISVYEHGELISEHKAITEDREEEIYWGYFNDDYENDSPYEIVIDREWDDEVAA